VWVDNSGAVAIANQRETSQRTRHIDRRHLKIREWVAEGHLVVKYKNTNDNHADVFTKPLKSEAFRHHIDAIMGDTSAPTAPARRPTVDLAWAYVQGPAPQ
jgi:hypothetical protein